ncbi:hypothetical protein ACQEVB_12925 [Pseudonocardia sp. CA-107938]|uniref:hypothetical protein n=1 Tax=Pseudonocardia sp. CA-107938 TaxID=3240021 RepID=UPI003D935294
MTTPEPPTQQSAPPPPPQPQPRRFRPTRTGVGLALAGLALLVVGGVAGALLFSRPAHVERFGPGGIARLDERGPGPFGPRFERGPGGRGDAWSPGRGREAALRGPVVLGTVVSTGNGTLVVAPDGAAQRTLRTDDRTRVAGPGTRSLAELKPGQRIAVVVSGSGDAATAVAVRAPQARVVGTVTAVAGDTATVTSADGLVVTVNTAAANPKPAVGDVIAVTGTASGTTITATTVTVLPKA